MPSTISIAGYRLAYILAATLIAVTFLASNSASAKSIAPIKFRYVASGIPTAIFESIGEGMNVLAARVCAAGNSTQGPRYTWFDCQVQSVDPLTYSDTGSYDVYWGGTVRYRIIDNEGVYGIVTGTTQVGGWVGFYCPAGYQRHKAQYCWASDSLANVEKNQGTCPSGTCCIGNPINHAVGNKTQIEIDLPGNGPGSLSFRRYYNSAGGSKAAYLGAGWRHDFDRYVLQLNVPWSLPLLNSFGSAGYVDAPLQNDASPLVGSPIQPVQAMLVVRPQGKTFSFVLQNGVWSSDADVDGRLIELKDQANNRIGWQFTDPAGDEAELYDASGRLTSIVSRSGTTWTLTYSTGSTPPSVALQPGLLIRAADNFGRELNFTYDSQNRLKSMTDPAGGLFQYSYDAWNNLTSATYPGTAVPSYLYGEPAYTSGATLPNALTGIVDENNQRFATWSYDTQGRAISSEHAGGAEKVTLIYGAGNTVVSDYKDSAGAVNASRTYFFQTVLGVQRNTSVSQSCSSGCGITASNGFDANGNIASRTDFNNNSTCFAYDLTRNLETARGEGLAACPADLANWVPAASTVQRKITTEWHPTWRLVKRTAEPKRITTYVYQGDGGVSCGATGAPCAMSVQATTDTNGGTGFGATAVGAPRTWAYTYNSFGQVLTVNGPRTDVNDITTYAYYTSNDVAGNYRIGDLASVTNALSQVTQISVYDAHGRPKTLTDPNGLVTQLDYWPRGWLKSRSVGGLVTLFDYDGVGQLTKVTLPDASLILYAYDPAHRLYQITSTTGERIVYTLDLMGNRTKEEVFDAGGNVVQRRQRVFDSLSRLQQELNAANQLLASYSYDNNGNLKTATRKVDGNVANDQLTGYDYDPLNRLKKVTDALAGVTDYGYDGLDHLTSVIDPKRLTTSYAVDGLDNATQTVSPDTGTTNQTFDSAGNLKTRTDARGVTSTYSYDALNRLTGITFSDTTPAISYSYDSILSGNAGKGRLSKLTDATGTTDYSYDLLGRLTQKKQATGTGTAQRIHTVSYSYDAQGRLASITYPSGRVVGYGYDSHGRVQSISVNGTLIVSGIQYHPFGAPKSWVWSTGLIHTRSIDLDGRMASYPFGAVSQNLSYDLADRITNFTGATTKTFGYDKLDRLINYAPSGATAESYQYDANGSRTEWKKGTSISTYVNDAASNKLASITGTGPLTYGYDATGSTTLSGTRINAYDARGRLVSTKATSTATATTFGVNAKGERLTKAGSGVTNGPLRYVYDEQGKLIAEFNSATTDNGLLNEFVYLGDIPIAINQGATNTYFIQTDHLNTPRSVLGGGNTQIWKWDSEPFGSTAANQDPDGNAVTFTLNLRFPGQYFDSQTGTHYNYFRDYNPKTGRYLQSDPIGLRGGVNTYGYVDQNPLNGVDPLGLQGAQPAIRPPTYPRTAPSRQEMVDNIGGLAKGIRDLHDDFGSIRTICRTASCAIANPPNQCTPDNPSGAPYSNIGGSIVRAPGSGGCVCTQYAVEVVR
jgi:RHS repeat-associated protein